MLNFVNLPYFPLPTPGVCYRNRDLVSSFMLRFGPFKLTQLIWHSKTCISRFSPTFPLKKYHHVLKRGKTPPAYVYSAESMHTFYKVVIPRIYTSIVWPCPGTHRIFTLSKVLIPPSPTHTYLHTSVLKSMGVF